MIPPPTSESRSIAVSVTSTELWRLRSRVGALDEPSLIRGDPLAPRASRRVRRASHRRASMPSGQYDSGRRPVLVEDSAVTRGKTSSAILTLLALALALAIGAHRVCRPRGRKGARRAICARSTTCRTGAGVRLRESYSPLDVELLFDEPTVALRGPWGGRPREDCSDRRRPLAGALPVPPRLPGQRPRSRLRLRALGTPPDGRNASGGLRARGPRTRTAPGSSRSSTGSTTPSTTGTTPHEGDWEMMQLVFDAGSPQAALERRPVEVGYSGHEGAERATWGDDKLGSWEDSSCSMHPAAGSHANFFDESLHLAGRPPKAWAATTQPGRRSTSARGCVTIPSDPATAEQFPSIEFQGRWGELQRSILQRADRAEPKPQWTEPIEWSEGWRSRSLAVPGGGALGQTRPTSSAAPSRR